jgi:hypothetical protein
MRKYFFCFLFLCVMNASAQHNYSEPVHSVEELLTLKSNDLNLTPVSQMTVMSCYRLWTNGQIVDVWIDSASVIRCRISDFVRDYDESSLGRRNYFIISHEVKSRGAAEVYYLFRDDFPELISWYNNSGYSLNQPEEIKIAAEFLDSGKYSMYNLTVPASHSSGDRSSVVTKFIEKLDGTLGLKKSFGAFERKIPFPCYIIGLDEVRCR